MRLMVWVIILPFVLIAAAAWFETGRAPSDDEIRAFEKRPYFKNGRFHSLPERIMQKFEADSEKATFFNMLVALVTSPHAPRSKLPQQKLEPSSFSAQPAAHAVYWLGHSAAILELDGKRVGVDLVLDNASPVPFTVRRYQKAPIERKNLPKFDYVLLTHNHYDHMERKTVKALAYARFIVPSGVGAALRGWGVPAENIVELGWGDGFEADGLKVTAVRGIHFSGRSFTDANKTLWNSYVIQTPKHKIFWGGDSGYGTHYADIGAQYGPFDWAALETDAWNAGWADIHLFPEQAVQAAQDLKAARLLPIHWGVYDLAYHPWRQSVDRVAQAADANGVELMTPMTGEKLNPFENKTVRWWEKYE